MNNRKVSSSSIFWGLVLLGVAIVIILEGIGVGDFYGFTVPSIAFGILMVAWLVHFVVKRKYYMIFLPLGLLYSFVLEKPIVKATNPANAKANGRLLSVWLVILASVLLCCGFKLLFNRKNVIENGKSEHGRLGNSTMYFDAANFRNATISENVGRINAYITNKTLYDGNGVITISDNIGNITLHIPENWLVVTDASSNLGKVVIPEQKGPTDKTITIVIRDNVGVITVEFDG